ncbi:MAG: alpha/beta hydrolase fold domain-containing protein, partial [Oscillospiraceae bacterium]|nr:alpha/beta hydrolase fold domain-containing protein [Oscillospiraceae bacterium]
AGGGLAAAVCMMARDRAVPVAFQMPLYPMLSNWDTETSRDNHGKVWNTRRNHLGWRLYLRREAKAAVSPYASPARQTDYRGLPPCYTFVGQGEPFLAETLQYAAALRAAGIEAQVDVYPTDMHAFDMLYPESPLGQKAIAAFEQHFEAALLSESAGNQRR